LIRRLRGGRFEPWRAAFSVGVGLFIGVQPLYGLHLPLCMAICLPFRLDALVAYAAANISNPLLAPLIVMAELQIGSLVVDRRLLVPGVTPIDVHHIGHLAWQLGVGAIVLGFALSILGGWLAAALVRLAESARRGGNSALSLRDLEHAVARTRARYHSAASFDRHYVANKLRFDPIVRAICETMSDMGDVVDIGCGRGQLGLALYELGRVRTLFGFDWDERKIAVAKRAATDAAQYSVGLAKHAAIPEADTILMVDVLHYLPFSEQDDLIARAAWALRVGGTLIVRDVDARRTLASAFTRWCERVGVRHGVNRGHTLSFRSREQHRQTLSRCGLIVSGTVVTTGLCLDNVLFFAVRPRP
jgi:2-polyprenyl-3-methyl-5-hydroxy-6-metoxy-1,4-benzoquinol methylase